MADIVFVTNEDDWQGLYVDGECLNQGQTLCPNDIFEHLVGETITSFKVEVVSNKWFPADLSDVKFKNNA